jgi:hypothetical protein
MSYKRSNLRCTNYSVTRLPPPYLASMMEAMAAVTTAFRIAAYSFTPPESVVTPSKVQILIIFTGSDMDREEEAREMGMGWGGLRDSP